MKYTYEDVITAKDILTGKVKEKDIIGKKGWFIDCIPQDMSLSKLREEWEYDSLLGVALDCDCPFEVKKTVAEETEKLISMLLRPADIGMSSVKCIETKARRADTSD